MPIGAAISGAAALGGAFITSRGAERAAGQQVAAADRATASQREMFDITRGGLQPFISAGGTARDILAYLTGGNAGGDPMTAPLTRPFEPTTAQLEQTPGYKFQLDQGMKALTNKATSMGQGGVSGPLFKGLMDYVTGTAQGTWEKQFQTDLLGRQNTYNMLYPQAQLGANAAAGLGSNATAVGGQIGSNLIGQGNAQAGATMAGTNAFAGALTGMGQNYMQYNLLQQLMANQRQLAGVGGAPAASNPLAALLSGSGQGFDASVTAHHAMV